MDSVVAKNKKTKEIRRKNKRHRRSGALEISIEKRGIEMYVKQFFWIVISYFVGGLLSEALGLPVPANVLGLVFLFGILALRWIRLSDVEDAADFIIGHLALIFVPSAVGIMEYFGLFQSSFIRIAVPWLGACVVGYAVTGWVTQAAIRIQEKRAGIGCDDDDCRGGDQ